jgi:hypothetical protein
MWFFWIGGSGSQIQLNSQFVTMPQATSGGSRSEGWGTLVTWVLTGQCQGSAPQRENAQLSAWLSTQLSKRCLTGWQCEHYGMAIILVAKRQHNPLSPGATAYSNPPLQSFPVPCRGYINHKDHRIQEGMPKTWCLMGIYWFLQAKI